VLAGLQMADMPPWFKCLVWMEVALQLPFFFVGAYAFLLRRNWIRTPALLYGINVTSTMVSCRALDISDPCYKVCALGVLSQALLLRDVAAPVVWRS
jgi:EXPERA (EXPanded EBP superfamily)